MLLSWFESILSVIDYNKNGATEDLALLAPVIFSLVPFSTIFILWESRKTTKDGNGLVLFLFFVSFIGFFPSFITAGHYFNSPESVHDSEMLQRSLKFAVWQETLLFIGMVLNMLPNSMNPCAKLDQGMVPKFRCEILFVFCSVCF